MPTYEYACTACGHRLEAVQRFTDEPLTECPECGGALRKVYGAVGIVLKGSGFYKTDSRAVGGQRLRNKGADAQNGASSAGDSSSKKESSPSEKGASEKGAPTRAARRSSEKSDSGKREPPARTPRLLRARPAEEVSRR